MQEFLQKLRDNPRVVVVTLIAAGVLALAIGSTGDNNQNADTDVTNEDTSSLSENTFDGAPETENTDTAMEKTEESTEENSDDNTGPVEVRKEDTQYNATVRRGDSQTVIAREMIENYLSDKSESLSAEQRLYVETTVVNSLPRNDLVYPGDVITVEETALSDAVAASRNLSESQLAAWSQYL